MKQIVAMLPQLLEVAILDRVSYNIEVLAYAKFRGIIRVVPRIGTRDA